MHGEGKKMKGSRAKGRAGLEKMFDFYALLATLFSLRIWLVRRRGGRGYAPTRVTVLTALTIHLFNVQKFSSRSYAFGSPLFGLGVFYVVFYSPFFFSGEAPAHATPWVPRRSSPPDRRGGPGYARPPLSRPCGGPGRRPLGCSRSRAWSHPGSRPALHRSAGRRVRRRGPLRAVPRRRLLAGGIAWGTSLPRCSGLHAARRRRGARGHAARRGLWNHLQVGVRVRVLRGPVPRSPSALMTWCAASSVRDLGGGLHGAIGSVIAVLLCLRAGGGMARGPPVAFLCPQWPVLLHVLWVW